MNIYKNLERISIVEILLFALIISFIINYYNNYTNKEGFIESKGNFIKMTENDVFDDQYCDLYDLLVYNSLKNNFEVDIILNSTTPNVQNKILDIGCSTGHHVNLLQKKNNNVIGIDNSLSMIKKAKINYPHLNFKFTDALSSMEFHSNTFTHISCLYFTIYYIKNKKTFLENCYNWLMPGGVLIIHLVDMYKFDPVIPGSTKLSTQSNIRNTQSIINFNELQYRSNFDLDNTIDNNVINLNNSNAKFKETIKFKNNKDVRINEHNLYISSQSSILSKCRDLGFILQSQTEMNSVNYSHNFIYTLQKPE